MADDQQQQTTPPITPTTETTAPPAPPSQSIDPGEYEALLQENAQWRAAFAGLEPQAERIKRLRDDPNAAQLFDNAISAYENFEKQRGPQIPDDQRPMYDKISKLESFVDRYEQQQKDEAERPQREFAARYNDWQNSAANNRFFTRLMADHPGLAPRDVQYLAQCAAEKNFEPLEETWKREGWRFVKPGDTAPPSSLRTDVGEVGIPSESTRSAPPNGGPSMRDRIVQLEKQRRGIA